MVTLFTTLFCVTVKTIVLMAVMSFLVAKTSNLLAKIAREYLQTMIHMSIYVMLWKTALMGQMRNLVGDVENHT